ncbi:MAG: hypothetical protein Q9191_006465 [Dirinaria sp. TL-2023a]
MVKDFALTNSHVIEPADITTEEQLQGISFGSQAMSITIVSPGEIDSEHTLETYAEGVKARQEVIDILREKIELGIDVERNTERLELHATKQSKDEDQVQLIKPATCNLAPCTAPLDTPAYKADSWSRGTRYLPYNLTLSEYKTHVKKGDQLFKSGRTTGNTWGTYTGFQADLDFGQGIQTAEVILGSENNFLEPGDSGSFIYDEEGCLVGLAVGGPLDRNFAYFIPIQLVFTEIEHLTGWKVVVPTPI